MSESVSSDSFYSEEIEVEIYDESEPVESTHAILPPFLNKFEQAKLLGLLVDKLKRTGMVKYCYDGIITHDSHIANKSTMNVDILKIAKEMLADGKVKFIIKRPLNDGKFEIFSLDQMR